MENEFLGAWSVLGHHGDACCRIARAWFMARDDADRLYSGATLPSPWLRHHFEWGPTRWPAYWCTIAVAEHVDCGVFADVQENLLRRRGIHCVRVQVIESASSLQTRNWTEVWRAEGVAPGSWIVGESEVYHEVLAVNLGGEAVIFDPTEHLVLGSRLSTGGEPMRMRLCADLPGCAVNWRGFVLEAGEWTDVSLC